MESLGIKTLINFSDKPKDNSLHIPMNTKVQVDIDFDCIMK